MSSPRTDRTGLSRRARVRTAAAVLALLLPVLAGCGNVDRDAVQSAISSAASEITSSRTDEPTQQTEQPTDQPTQQPTTETATETRTVAPSATPAPTTSPAADSTDSGSGLPWWVFALAAVLLVALVAWLVARSRRSRTDPWDAGLAAAAGDARWLAEGVAVQLGDRSRPPADVAGAWAAARDRVTTTEQRLYGLVQSAPDDERRARAQSLTESMDALSQALDTDVRLRQAAGEPGQDALLAESARTVVQRRQQLLALLQTLPTTTPASHR